MITDERIDKIYTELDKYLVDLLNDPKSLGPSYLQERMATCRNHLNNVSLLFSELSREKTLEAADLRAYEDAYKLEYDELLATDEHIKRLANIEDRKSTVAHTLRETQRKINETKRQVARLEAVLKVVIHRQRELHSTMDILKEQRRLMESDIKTGAMYGDERTGPGRGPVGGVEDDITADELETLMQAPLVSVTEELEEPPQTLVETPSEQVSLETAPPIPSEVSEAPSVDQDEQAIRRFLADDGNPSVDTKDPQKGSKYVEGEDLSSFLDSL
jgi:hypothetical protein